jgi:hypothetical protein
MLTGEAGAAGRPRSFAASRQLPDAKCSVDQWAGVYKPEWNLSVRLVTPVHEWPNGPLCEGTKKRHAQWLSAIRKNTANKQRQPAKSILNHKDL